MAITLVTGNPGSGKTYFAVKKMLDDFFKWDKAANTFTLKDSKYEVVADIDGLKIPHLRLDDELRQAAESEASENKLDAVSKVRTYFNYEYHQKRLENGGKPLIFIIDECQRYFGTDLGLKQWSREIYYFFEMHRHLGYSIIMVAHSVEKIAKGIRPLLETEIRAYPRSKSLFGEMRYAEFVGQQKVNIAPKVLKPDQKVYGLYKSQSYSENEKPKKVVWRYLTAAAVLFALLLYGIGDYFSDKQEIIEASKDKKRVYSVGQEQVVNKRGWTDFSLKKEAENEPRWVRVDWAKFKNQLWVFDPVTGRMMSGRYFPWRLRFDGREIYALVKN